jgi:hypothetical protein
MAAKSTRMTGGGRDPGLHGLLFGRPGSCVSGRPASFRRSVRPPPCFAGLFAPWNPARRGTRARLAAAGRRQAARVLAQGTPAPRRGKRRAGRAGAPSGTVPLPCNVCKICGRLVVFSSCRLRLQYQWPTLSPCRPTPTQHPEPEGRRSPRAPASRERGWLGRDATRALWHASRATTRQSTLQAPAADIRRPAGSVPILHTAAPACRSGRARSCTGPRNPSDN